MFKLIYKWTDKLKEKVGALSERLGEKGQGMVEYALILAAVAAIAVFALYTGDDDSKSLKTVISESFQKASDNIDTANTQE